MSIYSDVVTFNHNFGVIPERDIPFDANVLQNKPDLVRQCLELIQEEVRELQDAIHSGDFVEMIDALGDILYVVYGMCCRIGYVPTPRDNTLVFPAESINKNIISDNSELVLYYAKCISDNTKQVAEATVSKDPLSIYAVTSCLESIVSYVRALTAITGVDLQHVFTLIHENNMSKMCMTEDEAKLTVQQYKDQYTSAGGVYDSPVYRASPDQSRYVVYNESTKKVLKAAGWKPVDLSPAINKE